jgi:hypothetical protein
LLRPEYFLHQADICRRLACLCMDAEVALRLLFKAEEYEAKARAQHSRLQQNASAS